MKLRFKSLAELVAFRNKYIGTRARWFAPTPYFVHAERDDSDHRLWRHTRCSLRHSDGLEFLDEVEHGAQVAQPARGREL